jgi:ParB-like chromosome segregation protein Spo0J
MFKRVLNSKKFIPILSKFIDSLTQVVQAFLISTGIKKRYKVMYLTLEDIIPNRRQEWYLRNPSLEETQLLNPEYKWKKLTKSIQRRGITKPLEVREEINPQGTIDKPFSYTLVDGHHRYHVLRNIKKMDYKVKCYVYPKEVRDAQTDKKLRRNNTYYNHSEVSGIIKSVDNIKDNQLRESKKKLSRLKSKYKVNESHIT